MRGLGAFQMAQMKHKDARVLQFYRHVRSAIDMLELIALDPCQPPEKPAPEPVAAPPPAARPTIPEEKLVYRVREASEAIGLSRTTVWKAIANSALPAQKVGNRTLIPTDSLRAWLASMPPARRKRPT